MNGGDFPVISETNCRPGFGSDTKYNDFFFLFRRQFLGQETRNGSRTSAGSSPTC